MERETLLEASKTRHSVRQYDSRALTAEDEAWLRGRLEEINGETGLHLQLVCGNPHAFDNFLAHYMHFKGAVNYFALVGPDSPNLDVSVGYWGELLVLEAQARGMRTCWIGGTFSKRKTEFECAAGERLSLLICIGYGLTDGRQHPVRKTVADVTRVPVGMEAPDWFVAGAEEALLAPTAIHQQKFRFALAEDGEHVLATTARGSWTQVDLGIAKLHFELGSGKGPEVWA